ncbi:MAG: enoyl-CoA hydratase [Halieaceae bacterium]|jgi:enoyl-CoA hydratase|nr:enoyl-CoA hydratase [Halieaceae bacterium]
MTQQHPIIVDSHGPVALITLNRPEAYNALNHDLSTAIVRTFDELATNASVHVIVLTGAGKAFCAGVDLKELTANPGVLKDGGMGTNSPMVRALRNCGKPIIGAINGPAVTGGFELALACDFLYAATNARFADTHARVGLLPGWGLSQKLGRLIGINRAREASLTGNFIDAETAMDWGLVNKLCPSDTLIEDTLAAAQQIAESNPQTISAMRSLMNDGDLLALGDALELEGARGIAYLEQADFSQMESRLQALRSRAQKP